MSTRPDDLTGYVGQADLTRRLRVVMGGAQARETKPPHVLLSGPAGMGKTTLARIVAHELSAKLTTTSGPALRRPGDLAGIVMGLKDKDKDAAPAVLFIDEIHRLAAAVEETLYEVLEDGTISVVTGKGGEARAVTLQAPPFICVGATTKAGSLSAPLRDRFGFHGTMSAYTTDELGFMVGQEWARGGFVFTLDAVMIVAARCKGVPRRALHLAQRVLDVVSLGGGWDITADSAAAALDAFGVLDNGLDEIDWAILRLLTGPYAGHTVGLDALAQLLNVDTATIEREHEGDLVRAGYLVRTPSGRMAAGPAYDLVREADSRTV